MDTNSEKLILKDDSNGFINIENFQIENNIFNEELKKLYIKVFNSYLSEDFPDRESESPEKIVDFIEDYNENTDDHDYRVANPQLVTIGKDFMSGLCRIIHFGQETYGWGGEDPLRHGIFNPKLIPSFLMKLYAYHRMNHPGDKNWLYCDDLMERYSGMQVLHMNILLMGYPRGTTGGHPWLNYEVKDITQGIISIAKPHICIFHTGGRNHMQEYDNHIKKMIGDFEIIDELKHSDGKILASKIKFKDYYFEAVRTQHLNCRLSKEKWSEVNEYIKDIIDQHYKHL